MSNNWQSVASLDKLINNTGVCALVDGKQIAIFRVDDETFALDNHCPFSGANVISRGLVGDKNGVLKVASPLYKQNFCLKSGQCLDDESVKIDAYPTRIVDNQVQVSLS